MPLYWEHMIAFLLAHGPALPGSRQTLPLKGRSYQCAAFLGTERFYGLEET